MKITELFEDIPYRLVGNLPPDAEVTDLSSDVREVGSGHLFVCTRTALHDGHYAAPAAFEQGCRIFLAQRGLALPDGAATLVVEDVEAILGEICARFYGYPARSLSVLGITGSLGKSSVAIMTLRMLHAAGRRAALLMPTGILREDSFSPLGSTVPDAIAVARFLHQCAGDGTELAILELSPYMLEHKCSFSIPFTALLLTNAAPRLLGAECPDPKAHLRALCTLLESSAPFKIQPVAGDIPCEGGRVLRFGEGGDFSAELPEPFVGECGYGTRFTLCAMGEKIRISLPVPGDFAIENALAATALAMTAGVELRVIAQALESAPCWGMLECLFSRWGRCIYRDAAYSPAMLERALRILRERTPGKLTVVLGSVGGRARHRRAPLGRIAEQIADFVFLCADDPNCEDPSSIAADIAKGFDDPSRYAIIPDRREAILRAIGELREGDTLLLAGKGREVHQLVAGERLPFSESDIVKQALLELYP